MQIFKFGGASVKDAKSIENVLAVLEKTGADHKLVVVSAIGKTTNALEKVVQDYLENSPALPESIARIKEFHLQIANELFPSENHRIFGKITSFFQDLNRFLNHNKSPNYDFVYDQIICFGELLSSVIISEYLALKGAKNQWIDVRRILKTNDTYREAEINWDLTQKNISTQIAQDQLAITQGFIASDENNFSTSLGREGSDYSAAVFAYCLNAENLTIWKDVDGIMNGDPRVFKNTQLLEQISYEEAIELAFYGASVIHPKTLQPLQKKAIPLFVKSFYKPNNPGTRVCNLSDFAGKEAKIQPEIPCFILKENLWLISLSSLDFSFIVEKNVSEIFALFDQYQLKVDLIQNSAISFSVCVADNFNTAEKLIAHLKANYKVSYNQNVSLYTVRHYDEAAVSSLKNGKKILLQQFTQKTFQMVVG